MQIETARQPGGLTLEVEKSKNLKKTPLLSPVRYVSVYSIYTLYVSVYSTYTYYVGVYSTYTCCVRVYYIHIYMLTAYILYIHADTLYSTHIHADTLYSIHTCRQPCSSRVLVLTTRRSLPRRIASSQVSVRRLAECI